MLKATRDMILPTAITGSYPRPLWFDRSLDGRSFKAALGDSLFREQYLDAVAAIINAQEAAGLEIVTDGDSRFDLVVGGKSWFFYPIERLGGIQGHRLAAVCQIPDRQEDRHRRRQSLHHDRRAA
jgi:5-methyltetrahydropteroyltriglutamate--homocysteine methyltransferase